MMSTEKPSRDTIFCAAVEIASAEERTAYIATACGEDSDLRGRVEKLVEAHFRAGSFLDQPAVPGLTGKLAPEPLGGETQACDSAAPIAADDLGFLTPSDQSDSLGRFGHYEIQDVVGRGGMGIVLRAFDGKLHRVVAIKVMAAQLATNGTARKRFTREAQAAAAVSHDHIVTIHAVEDANGLPYLVMHFVSGMSLQERLERSGPLQVAEIVRIGMQTAAGLAAAHAQGLVHRDIKPANILLENGVERVKITDFGLARAASDASLTQSGVVAGTPQFMSPEQARGEAVDQRTDLFSLGSVLYAMCTGRAPFRASESMAVLKRVCEDAPRPIRETNADIPDWLVAIIDKLHAKDPADRYQTAAEVAALLNQHLAHLQHPSVAPLPVTKPAKLPAARRRRIATVVALLCLTAIVIGVGAARLRIFDSEGTPPGKEPAGKDGPAALTDKAFVVLGGKAIAQRKFDTLAEAVQGASDGDTIEVRGNGPFVIKPIVIQSAALTIRAGESYRPVIKADSDEQGNELLLTNAPLVLEGLEFQWVEARVLKPGGGRSRLVVSSGPMARLHVVNCRFLMNRREGAPSRMSCIGLWNAPLCHIRNCQFLVGGQGKLEGPCISSSASPRELMIENSLFVGTGVQLKLPEPMKVVLNRNTFLSAASPLTLYLDNKIDAPEKAPIQVETSANIVEGRVQFVQSADFLAKEKALHAEEVRQLLIQLIGWRESRNLYLGPATRDLLRLTAEPTPGKFNDFQPAPPTKTLDDWKNYWGIAELDSERGLAAFQGGNLVAKGSRTPEQLMPEDFRLSSGSAGYKAGKDGKDLGADVDLVGPGEAYERWKQTPEYQGWLKETKQAMKVVASNPEPKAAPAKTVDDAAKRELAKLQGEWENEKGEKLTIKGDQWGWSLVNQTLDPAGMLSLKVVEVTDKMTHVLFLNKKHDGKFHTCQVILNLDGDTLHYCGTYEPARPTEFATSPGYLYFAWKRPAKQDKAAAAKELEKLQGKWSLVSLEKDGRQVKGEDPNHTFTLKEKNWTVYQGEQLVQAGTVERIDVMEKHAVIYIVDTSGRWGVNIYKIEGDALRWLLCNNNRVTEFTTTPGDDRIYATYRRIKP
jgi:uncharacterized protein (TIGR03067 family)